MNEMFREPLVPAAVPATAEHAYAAAVPEPTGEAPAPVDTAPAAAAQAAPEGLLVRGTFAIYDDGGGGLVLVAQPEGGPVQYKRITPMMVKAGHRILGSLFGG